MWFKAKQQVFALLAVLMVLSVTAKPTQPNNDDKITATLNLTATKYQTAWEHLNKTCLLNDCAEHVNLQHLQHIAKHMNRAINPCENFHAYACSYWQQQHPQQKTVMALGEQQLNDKFTKIFTQHTDFADSKLKGNLVMQKMQKYLEVCLLSERSQKATWQHYLRTLRELGYLQYDHQTYNWLTTLRELNLFSNSRYFISLQIERFNVSRYMLSIEPHNLLERVNFSLDVYEILKMFTNQTFTKLKEDFRNLEINLEKIIKSSNNCLNECDLTEWLSYEQLINRNATADLNWKYLLADFPLDLHDQILVNDFKTLIKIKSYLDQAEQETLFLYALTHFVNYLKGHSHNIVDQGSSQQTCLRHMRKHFPLAMNYLYEINYYSLQRASSDRVIKQIFSQLKQQFSLIIEANKMQFSLKSLQYLSNKLQYLQLNIGNLPLNASQHFYAEYMADLNVTHDFYTNHLMSLKHFFHHQRLLASASKFSHIWFTFNLHMPNFLDNLDSTAYYFSTGNIIILPFAYLQLPFYDYRFWPSLLFGDLANTLGHELIHAFDIKFLENDFAGNYNDRESAEILHNKFFQQHMACLSKEPTKYLTERIADISGTHLALKTFIRDPLFLQHNGKLFFLQFAQFFCGASALTEFQMQDDSHDLDSLRLNYTLSHMPEFAQVFQCPVGSPMNPLEKCKLW